MTNINIEAKYLIIRKSELVNASLQHTFEVFTKHYNKQAFQPESLFISILLLKALF